MEVGQDICSIEVTLHVVLACQLNVDLQFPSKTSILVEGKAYINGFITCAAASSPTLVLNLYHIDSQGNRQIVVDGGDGGRVGLLSQSVLGITLLTGILATAKVSDRGIYECEGQDNGMTSQKNAAIYVDGRHKYKEEVSKIC